MAFLMSLYGLECQVFPYSPDCLHIYPFFMLPMTVLVGIVLFTTIITNLACYEGYQYGDSYYDGDFDANRDASFEQIFEHSSDDKLQTRINEIVGEY